MESQPQSPEFRNNPENLHPYIRHSLADSNCFFGLFSVYLKTIVYKSIIVSLVYFQFI